MSEFGPLDKGSKQQSALILPSGKVVAVVQALLVAARWNRLTVSESRAVAPLEAQCGSRYGALEALLSRQPSIKQFTYQPSTVL